MKWRSVFWEEEGYLEFVVLENPTCGELNKMADERRIKLQQLDCSKTLFDFTAITSMLNTFEVYRLPDEIERLGIGKVSRSACVVPMTFLREFKLMESLAQEQGYDFRVFQNKEHALRYLIAGLLP